MENEEKIVKCFEVHGLNDALNCLNWIKKQYTQLRTVVDYEQYIKENWNVYTNLRFFVWSDNTWTAGFHLDMPWEKEFDKQFSEDCIYDSYRAMKIKRILK